MTRKVMSEIFINMNRTLCHRSLRVGRFRGAYAVTVRFNAVPDIGPLTRLSDALVKDPGIGACEVWTAVDLAGQPVSMKKSCAAATRRSKPA